MLHLAGSPRGLSTALGTGIALFGSVVAVYGAVRYAATERALATGRVAAGVPGAARLAAGVTALIGAVVAYVLIAVR